MLSSGKDMAVIFITSQQLWLPEQDLYKIKLGKWS